MKLIPIILFFICISLVDRKLLKSNHGFSLHVIESQVFSPCDPNLKLSFPTEIFQQPFYYLGRGAQSFVFESGDKSTVIKFYRFPSHLRRFPWTHHPFGYLFSKERQQIKEYNLQRLALTFHSFFLAGHTLADETGTLYVHLHPTTDINKRVHLIDKLGSHYHLPLDHLVFVVQKRGDSFLKRFKQELNLEHMDECKMMLTSLIELIQSRCRHGISDLDNMEHDNYGWCDGKATHLDIGRFQEKENISVREEVERVASPLIAYLKETSPELSTYFQKQCINCDL